KLRRQPAVLPLRGPAAGVTIRIAEHDERGQVLVLGPKGVADPSTQRWPAREDLARVDAAHGLRMIIVLAEHRTDHAPVVGHLAHVGKQLREVHAGLAMAAEAVAAGHQPILVAAGLKALDLAGMSLTVAALKLGLGIEEIDLAGTPGLLEK